MITLITPPFVAELLIQTWSIFETCRMRDDEARGDFAGLDFGKQGFCVTRVDPNIALSVPMRACISP
jgi:hypothetical protein